MWVPCHHSVSAGTLRRPTPHMEVTANMLSKQIMTDDNGWFSNMTQLISQEILHGISDLHGFSARSRQRTSSKISKQA